MSVAVAESDFNLGEIIVSGKTPRVVESVGTVDIVTAEDIQRSGARDLNEAIKLLPGLYVRTGGDGTPRIDIRGLRTRQVIILLDGAPINSTIDGQFDPSAIDVANIDRIKVTRGAGSVLYGAGGNAGVINIITRAGAGRLHGNAMAEFGDNGVKHGSLSAGGGSGDWQTFASASGFHQDSFDLSNDYDPVTTDNGNFQPKGERINSDRTDANFYANVIWSGLPGTEIGLSGSYRRGHYGKPFEVRDPDDDPFARNPKFERVDKFKGYSFSLTGKHEFTEIPLTMKPMLYFNHLDELTNGYNDANFNLQDGPGASRSDAHTEIYGGNLQLAYDLKVMGLATIAGDCRHEAWETDGFSINNKGKSSTVSIDVHDDVCFVGYEHELSLLERLGLVGGVGYAWQNKPIGNDESGLTYLLGAYYNVFQNTQLNISYARKIRFATLRDLFEPGRANPDLKAETTFNYEAGITQTFFIIPASLGVTVFRIDANDFIESPVGGGMVENIEEDRFQGVEVTGDITPLPDFLVRAGYTFLDSENRSPGVLTTHMQNRPEHQLSVELNYHLPGLDTDFYLSWLHIERQFELERGNNPAHARETGDYDVFDLKVEKRFGNAGVFGRAMNMLDEDYVESGGFPAPGRTILVGGELDFGL